MDLNLSDIKRLEDWYMEVVSDDDEKDYDLFCRIANERGRLEQLEKKPDGRLAAPVVSDTAMEESAPETITQTLAQATRE